MKAGEVQPYPGSTKNGEARTFPLTTELWRVLEAQQVIAENAHYKGSGSPDDPASFCVHRTAVTRTYRTYPFFRATV